MSAMPWNTRIWSSVFQSVTARTAGFNTLPIGSLTMPSLIVLSALMFIGASPGSTGGGIKTCTFAVLWATVASMMKNKKRVMIMDRSVPRQIVREAIVIFFLALSWVFIFTVLLTFFEGRNPVSGGLMKSFFEVVSAFGTVGLSAGKTGALSEPGKLCIIATMFAGRLGPLTLALAVAFRETTTKFTFPEENLMVG